MDTRQLKYFIAVIDHRNFSRAAEHLQITQPSLAPAIAGFERELGVPLFHRVSRGVVPTDAGGRLVEPARRVLRGLDAAHSTIDAVESVTTGRVEIIATASPGVQPLTTIVGYFTDQHPNITLSIAAGSARPMTSCRPYDPGRARSGCSVPPGCPTQPTSRSYPWRIRNSSWSPPPAATSPNGTASRPKIYRDGDLSSPTGPAPPFWPSTLRPSCGSPWSTARAHLPRCRSLRRRRLCAAPRTLTGPGDRRLLPDAGVRMTSPPWWPSQPGAHELSNDEERKGTTAMPDISRLPKPLVAQWEWQIQAACRGMDTATFFHPPNERDAAREGRIAQAKAICSGCPAIDDCLNHALRVREPYGVWGGLSEDERASLLGVESLRYPKPLGVAAASEPRGGRSTTAPH